MYQLYELCRWNARYIIDEGHKDLILNHNTIVEILAVSLKELDKLNGIRPFSNKEYLEMAHNHKELDFISRQIDFVRTTYKNINTDKGLKPSEKIAILKKSVDVFEDAFEDLSMQDEYLDNEDMSNKHAQIIIDFRNKLDAKDGALPILDFLEKSNNNFLLSFNNDVKVYPVIVDLLYDTFTLEYEFSKEDDIVDILKSKKLFPSTQKKYTHENAFNIKFYAKIEFKRQVHSKKGKIFILNEFARALKCDIKLLKKLYKELLYYDPAAHPNALISTIDISKIAPRQFLMPTIKMVKKIEYTGIKNVFN